MRPTIYTIGHSTYEEEYFVALLRKHEITAVCDVRSVPFSRNNPQFNRAPLEATLRHERIEYRFLGKELGARSDDPACYENGKVQYDRLAATELFKRGLDRLQRGLRENFRIALMCAEKEPLDCHRSILIAPHLIERKIDVEHILENGSVEKHFDSVRRLMSTFESMQADMFISQDELFSRAYKRQERRIAYDKNADEARRKESGAA